MSRGEQRATHPPTLVWRELSARHPIIDFRVLRHRKQQAIAMIDRQVMAQASVIGFGRIFWLSGLALLVSLPLLVLVQDAGGGSGGAVHME